MKTSFTSGCVSKSLQGEKNFSIQRKSNYLHPKCTKKPHFLVQQLNCFRHCKCLELSLVMGGYTEGLRIIMIPRASLSAMLERWLKNKNSSLKFTVSLCTRGIAQKSFRFFPDGQIRKNIFAEHSFIFLVKFCMKPHNLKEVGIFCLLC